MGIVAKAQADALATIRRRPKSRRVGVSAAVETSQTTEEFLERFPIELRHKVLRQAVRAAGRPVVSAARKRLASHRSSVTGTRKKWSQKVREKRQGATVDLYKSMRTKVKDYGSATIAFVGPKLPEGSHSHLLEFGGRRILWGGDTIQAAPEPFLRPAADETKPQQKRAMVEKVKKEWQKV